MLSKEREAYLRKSVEIDINLIEQSFRSDFSDIVELLAEIDKLRFQLKQIGTQLNEETTEMAHRYWKQQEKLNIATKALEYYASIKGPTATEALREIRGE